MRLGSSAWLTDLAGLGQAFTDVLKAEWAALTDDLSQSGRTLLRGLAIICLAIVMVGWVAGLLSLALVFLLSLYLPTWVAALIVAGALAVLAAALFLWGKAVLGEVRPPGQLVQTHVDGHVEWLQGQMRGAASATEEIDDADGPG